MQNAAAALALPLPCTLLTRPVLYLPDLAAGKPQEPSFLS